MSSASSRASLHCVSHRADGRSSRAFEPRFLSQLNLFNVMRQVSITGLLAVGMTFVILTAGIDLSVGSLLAFAGLVAAAVAKGGLENRFTVGAGSALAMAGSLAALGGGRGRPRRRLAPGTGDHPVQGAALRRDARRHVGFPRRRASVRWRRADQRASIPSYRLVGTGEDRTGAGSGDHLPARRSRHRPYRAALHALRPAGLCGRRQSGGGAPVRAQRHRDRHERLRDHGLLSRVLARSCFRRVSIRRRPSPAPATS